MFICVCSIDLRLTCLKMPDGKGCTFITVSINCFCFINFLGWIYNGQSALQMKVHCFSLYYCIALLSGE